MQKTLLLLLACPAIAAAQITLEGDVVRRSTGEPLAGVAVMAPCASTPRMLTDGIGHFRCVTPPGLPPSSFPVVLNGPGLLPRRQTVSYTPQDTHVTIKIAMTPQAVIAGKVLDEDHWPVAATVTVGQYIASNGERHLEAVRSVQTDDRGAYRIGKLPPGRYYLRIEPAGGAPWGDYLPVWYPGAPALADARPIDLREGQEAAGTDIQFARCGGVTLRGRVMLPAGYQITQGYLTIGWEELRSTHPMDPVPILPDGTFQLRHVPPGTYKLLATTSNSLVETTPPRNSALRTVEVAGENIDGITLNVAPTVVRELKGTVVWEGPRPDQVHVTVARSPRLSSVEVVAGGGFVIPGIWPGRYRVSAWAENGHVTSIRFGSQEILDRDLEFDGAEAALRVTVRGEGVPVPVSGTLRDAADQPVVGATVILVRSGAQYVPPKPGWRQPPDTDQYGAFTAWQSPGVYRVYVVRDASETSQSMSDPAFLNSAEKAYPPVTVSAGENRPVKLQLPR